MARPKRKVQSVIKNETSNLKRTKNPTIAKQKPSAVTRKKHVAFDKGVVDAVEDEKTVKKTIVNEMKRNAKDDVSKMNNERKRVLNASPNGVEKKKKKILDIRSLEDRVEALLLTVGWGDTGQLGLGEDHEEVKTPRVVDVSRIIDVAAAAVHTICLTADGKVISFGCNDDGALGRETSADGSDEWVPGPVDLPGKAQQISAGDSHSAALLQDGRLYFWGVFRDSDGAMVNITKMPTPEEQEEEDKQQKLRQRTPVPIVVEHTIVKIASGANHLVLLTDEGQLFTCGCGDNGQLGRVAECFSHRKSRKGLDHLVKLMPVFTQRVRGKPLIFEDVWTGQHSTFAKVQTTGEIYACGLNNYNQLALSDHHNRFTLVRSPQFCLRQWQAIAGGEQHTLALDAAGKVYVIGRHDYGRLGLGDTSEPVEALTMVPPFDGTTISCVSIAASICSSYAVAENGDSYAWGMGDNGRLGTGNEEDKNIPAKMVGAQLRDKKVISVSCNGGNHCALLAVKVENGLQCT